MKIINLEKFMKVSADEGMYLTRFRDGEDILTFTSAKVIYAPLGTKFENLKEITKEENDKYEALLESKLKELNF